MKTKPFRLNVSADLRPDTTRAQASFRFDTIDQAESFLAYLRRYPGGCFAGNVIQPRNFMLSRSDCVVFVSIVDFPNAVSLVHIIATIAYGDFSAKSPAVC